MTTRAKEASGKAKASEIIIDLILVGDAETSRELVNAYLSLPNQTGGTISYIDSSSEFAGAVEDLYFSSYSYSLHSVTGINSTNKEQQVSIAFPTDFVDRGRPMLQQHWERK